MTRKENEIAPDESGTEGFAAWSKADLLDVILGAAPDGIVVADQSGLILSFNQAAEALFGYEATDVAGRNLSLLMPSTHAEHHDDYMRRYLETGEKRIIGAGRDVAAMRSDGETFMARLEIGELKTARGSLFVAFLSDRTEEIEATKEATRLKRLLEQAGRERLVGEMSTAIAHELNQPLTAISNFAKAAAVTLEKEDGERDKARAYLDRVVEQSLRSAEIIKRLRGFVEKGEVNLKPHDINEIVEEAIRVSETGVEDSSIRLDLHLGEDLPPVLADRFQVQQVVVNLLRNAREAVESGGGDAERFRQEIVTNLVREADRIEMKASLNGDNYVVVTVSDTGPGVPPDMLSAIFDPMVTTKASGFGVGLAICRSIVHAHGGNIWAENNPAGGANVHFTLRTSKSR